MKIETKCENCGKQIFQTITQYKKGKHHYCSQKCQKEFQHKMAYEQRICLVCNLPFEVSKKSKQRLCSIQCQHEWQKTNIGKNNPKYTRVKHKCDYCNKEYYMKQYKLNQKNNFCSNQCRQRWYGEVWAQSDAWKEKSRIRAANILKNNPSTQTKPQVIINQILKDNSIIYENEKAFQYYSVDNYLSEYNLIIEVMGDYWHSNPFKYQDNLNTTQKKIIAKDRRKHSYFINNHQIEILYLWEFDIYNRVDLCKKLIEKYIENKGLLKNYNSFNYDFQNDELVLHKTITQPYFNKQ